MFELRNRNSAARQAPPLEGHGLEGAERATFAAGCFWVVETAFREIRGVLQTAVGYTGGDVPRPSYAQVCGHRAGHAEAVEVWFDPAQVSYAPLLETFWRIRIPTTRDRRGWDFGRRYRSAIFFHGAEQRARAIASRDAEQQSLTRQIVTEITPASAFYRAEEYHQRYLEKRATPIARSPSVSRRAARGKPVARTAASPAASSLPYGPWHQRPRQGSPGSQSIGAGHGSNCVTADRRDRTDVPGKGRLGFCAGDQGRRGDEGALTWNS